MQTNYLNPLQHLFETFMTEYKLYLEPDERKEILKTGKAVQFYFEISQETFQSICALGEVQGIKVIVPAIPIIKHYGPSYLGDIRWKDHFVPLVKTDLPKGKAILRRKIFCN